MEIKFLEKPKDVTIIQGFPGIGMIGSVSTEFLIEHLNVKKIANIVFDEIPATIAIHKGKIIPPVGLYYNEEKNLAIINYISQGKINEWELVKLVEKIAWELSAKEIITIDGVLSSDETHEVYAFSNNSTINNKLKELEFKELKESIILGVTAGLIQKERELTSFFISTNSQLPDSTAAAEAIKSIDKYLLLDIDYKPLLEQAKVFETKIKNILSKSEKTEKEKEKSIINYMS